MMQKAAGVLGTGMELKLDKRALFALASDTRVDILRALRPMRRTVTQLARELEIDKSAIHRHLQKLVEGGLVKRYDDHGFVYYGLSWKSRDILDPNDNTKIVILLASSLLIAMVAVAAILAGLSPILAESTQMGGVERPAEGGEGHLQTLAEDEGDGIFLPAEPGGILPWTGLGVALAFVPVVLLFLAARRIRVPKQFPVVKP